MDYEKKYKDALERAKELIAKRIGKNKDFYTEDYSYIFPELAESEDDRIRKDLIAFLIDMKDGDVSCFPSQSLYQRWIAYLEKQKEQKQYEPKNWPADKDALTQEQKSAASREEVLHQLFQNGSITLSDYLYLTGKQKPVEPSDDELQRHQDELYDFKVFATKQAKEHHISFAHDFEWNNFCAELLSYFAEQKPAWNEEDEKQIHQIERIIKFAGCSKQLQEKIHNFLNFLRPQYHGDVTMTEAYKMGKEAGEAASWKPSEEQLEAFRSYIKDFQEKAEAAVGGWNNFDVMIRLFEQLKKLM